MMISGSAFHAKGRGWKNTLEGPEEGIGGVFRERFTIFDPDARRHKGEWEEAA